MTANNFETEVLRQFGKLHTKIDLNEKRASNRFVVLESSVGDLVTENEQQHTSLATLSQAVHDHILKDDITQQFKAEQKETVKASVKSNNRITVGDIKGFVKIAGFIGMLAGSAFAGASSCDDTKAVVKEKPDISVKTNTADKK